MTRWLHENTNKRHRCPQCHCVMPWRYRPVRKWLYEHQSDAHRFLRYDMPRGVRWTHHLVPNLDHRFPRRCHECGDVIAVPAWLAKPLRIRETY